MKYSTRPKNARDRSPKVKRSSLFNFQKHHRPQPVTVFAKVQQCSRPLAASAQPTSYVVVDDQQPGTFRQMIFNPPSVAPSQQDSITLLDYPVSLVLFQVCFSISKWTHPIHFHPLNFQLQPAPSPVPLPFIMNIQDLPASPASRVRVSQNSGLASTSLTKTGPSQGHLNLPKTINKLHVCPKT